MIGAAFRTLVILLAAPVWASVAAAQSREALIDAARAFDEAALRRQDDNAKPMPIRKWMGAIKLAFANPRAAPALVEISRRGVGTLAGEAGIELVDIAEPGPAANYIVYFDENGTRGQAGDCSATGRWTDKWVIYKGELRINPVRMRDIERCAIHEPMHLLGFFSHPHAAFSVLSYVYKAQRTLTPLDKHLIHTLYDPRLTPGLKPAPASELACRILGERMAATASDIDAVCRDRKGPTS